MAAVFGTVLEILIFLFPFIGLVLPVALLLLRATFLRPRPKLSPGEKRILGCSAIYLPGVVDRGLTYLEYISFSRRNFSVSGFLYLTDRRVVWLPYYPFFGRPHEVQLSRVEWAEKGKRIGLLQSLIIETESIDRQYWVSWSMSRKFEDALGGSISERELAKRRGGSS